MKKIAVGMAVLAIGFGLPVWATTFYASPSGGGDGSSSERPTTLADAVAKATAAGAGAVVQLSAETFEMAAETTIAADITVQGAGRDQTIVKRKSGGIRLFALNSAGAVLQNLTVSDGNGVNGANVYINANGGTVRNCVLRNGRRDSNGCGGSAIWMQAGTCTGCIITNNLSKIDANQHSGAAVYFRECKAAAVLENCIIADNLSWCNLNSFVGAAGVTFYDNTASKVTIRNCTFARNRGVGYGAIYAQSTGAMVTNCLFTGNRALRSSPENRDYNGNLTVRNCAFEADATRVGTDAVTGNVRINDDFSPVFDSVAIGAAADGSDIGAVQHTVPSEIVGYVTVSTTRLALPAMVTFDAHFTDGTTADASYAWDFDGDGEVDDTASGATPTHAYETLGTYTPKVTVTIGGASKTFVCDAVTVCPAEAAVASVAELQDALAAAGDGSVITVAKGDYEFASGTAPYTELPCGNTAVIVDKGVTIRGATGNPEDVVFRVRNNSFSNITASNRTKVRLMMLHHPEAFVTGISFRFGFASGVYYYGGGMLVDYNGGTVSNCTFTGNSCYDNQSGGAAVGMYGGLLTHSIITNNHSRLAANNGSGANLLIWQNAVARNCLIANNTAAANADKTDFNIGGVGLYGSSVLENCTVAGNSSFGTGGVKTYEANAIVRNCQIQDNQSSGYASDPAKSQYIANKAANFINCACSVEISGGTNCKTGAMPVGDKDAGNWRPAFGSVALGAGLVQDWMTGAGDLDGKARLGEDGKVDAGAYQYAKAAIGGSFSMSVTAGAAPLAVTFAAEAYSEAGAITGYVWDFGDGSAEVETDVPAAAHTYETPVAATPKLFVIVGGVRHAIDSAQVVRVAPAFIYVTNEPNEQSAEPYDRWETAATNLFDAVAASGVGSTIVLKRGRHEIAKVLSLESNIILSGETDDPADTELHVNKPNPAPANYTQRCLVLDSAGIVVKGLTISGGEIHDEAVVYGANIYLKGFGGTITNCIITGGSIVGNGPNASGGAAAAVLGGLITHCIISNNVSQLANNDNGSGGGTINLQGGRVEYCLITGNQVKDSKSNGHYGPVVRLYSGKMYNCTIVSNDVGSGWSVARAGTDPASMVNCLVACNVKGCTSDAVGCLSHCATDVDTGKADCFFAEDMKFVDPANGDWRIHYQSVAAKNADASVIKATRDLAGVPTVYLRNKADIGCYTRADKPGMSVIVK